MNCPVLTVVLLDYSEFILTASDLVIVFGYSCYGHDISLFLDFGVGLSLRFYYNIFQQNFQQKIVSFNEIFVHMYRYVIILLPVIF